MSHNQGTNNFHCFSVHLFRDIVINHICVPILLLNSTKSFTGLINVYLIYCKYLDSETFCLCTAQGLDLNCNHQTCFHKLQIVSAAWLTTNNSLLKNQKLNQLLPQPLSLPGPQTNFSASVSAELTGKNPFSGESLRCLNETSKQPPASKFAFGFNLSQT